MFRKKGDGNKVELNIGTGYKNGLSIEERNNRLTEYWFGYWSGVRRLL
jgi:predicted N-formylglutamate amidohydrolase